MRPPSVKTPSRGFGMVEVLVAGVIAAIVMMGVMRVMKLATDGQRRADVKGDLLAFENRIRNLLGEAETCKAVLVDQLPNKVFDPAALTAYNEDPVKSAGVIRLTDGTLLKDGSSYATFSINRLSLKLVGPIPPETGGRYEAMIGIDPGTGTGARMLAGGDLRDREIPLVLTTTYDNATKLRTINGCYLRNANGREMCESIGGRWLGSLTRCYFGGDLKLNQFQCLDPAEFDPGGPLEGAIVQECYYRQQAQSARLTTYRCANFPNPKYPRCDCRTRSTASQTGWQILRPLDGRYYRSCDAGVLIKVPDEQTYFLEDNEIVEGTKIGTASGETAPPVSLALWQENADLLDSVMNCYFEDISESMRALKCNQLDKSHQALPGSCVFVNGARVSFNGVTWTDNYTGWIRVSHARSAVVIGKNPNAYTAVSEALGRRCQYVQVLQGMEKAMTDTTSDLVDPAAQTEAGKSILEDSARFRDVAECVFLGGNGPTTPTPPSVRPFRGAYLNRYPCKNQDVDPLNLTGDVAKESNPSLNRYSCWYFKNVRLPASLAQNWVPGVSGGLYTGWAYLRGDLADEQWDADTDTDKTPSSATMVVSPQTGKTPVLNAVPCNLGVRLSQ